MQTLDPARVSEAFGRRVAECRQARGLTQEAFAARIERGLKWVQAIEAGQQNVRLDTLVRLANGLGVPVGSLFDAPRTAKAGPGRPKQAVPSRRRGAFRER